MHHSLIKDELNMAYWDRNVARNVRDMPYRRRHQGLTALERYNLSELISNAIQVLTVSLFIPVGFAWHAFIFIGVGMLAIARDTRLTAWNALDHVDETNRDRLIDSFTDNECWIHLRFRRVELHRLFALLNFPISGIVLVNRSVVPSEAAFVLMLYKLHDPSTFAMLQKVFGREYSQLSRIFNATIRFMHRHHGFKINANVDFYSERFDLYADAVARRISSMPITVNPFPGTVPNLVANIFAFLDGHAQKISRPWRHQNAQHPFWNGYYHGHFIKFPGWYASSLGSRFRTFC